MKFILTKELGRLAKWLRILGFDAKYFSQGKEASLVIEALRDDRTILTRNRRLTEHPGIKILQIKHDSIYEQVRQITRELAITPDETLMFCRCTICNEVLQPAEKEKVKDRVPRYVFETNNDFFLCPACRRLYWRGSHWGNVRKTLEKIGI